MRWYRDRGSGGLRPRDVGDVCDMEAEDVYPTRCGNIAVKRNTRTAMPSDRLGHCVTLALGPHSCPCPCHLGGWWLMMAGVSNRLNTARLLGTLFLTTCSFVSSRAKLQTGRATLDNKATTSRISRMPCNKLPCNKM
jgi:hypothetical protein